MARIPPKNNKAPILVQQVNVNTDEVKDNLGYSLSHILRKQKYNNEKQDDNITIATQHAALNVSDLKNNKLIFRDVFPGHKYKLTLSDTSWMGDSNVCTIGYTVGNTFTQISSTATAPEDNVFDVEIPVVSVVETLEVRLVGASNTVKGYLEDSTTSSSISGSIANILQALADLISGQSSLSGDVRQLQQDVADLVSRVGTLENSVSSMGGDIQQIQQDISSLDDRVTALENE